MSVKGNWSVDVGPVLFPPQERDLLTGALKDELPISNIQSDLAAASKRPSILLTETKLFDLASGRVEYIFPGSAHGGGLFKNRLRKGEELQNGMALAFVEPKKFFPNTTHKFWYNVTTSTTTTSTTTTTATRASNVSAENNTTATTTTTKRPRIQWQTEYDPRVIALISRFGPEHKGVEVPLQFDDML